MVLGLDQFLLYFLRSDLDVLEVDFDVVLHGVAVGHEYLLEFEFLEEMVVFVVEDVLGDVLGDEPKGYGLVVESDV